MREQAKRSRARLSRRGLIRLGTGALAASHVAQTLSTPGRAASQGTPVATPISPAAGPVQLLIQPNPVRVDERFDVVVTGLEPLQTVTLTSAFTDALSQEWTARVTVGANTDGWLNVSSQAPAASVYDVADAMGLIWAAIGGFEVPGPDLFNPSPVQIAATIDDLVVAREQVVRTFLPDDVRQRDVREAGLVGTFFEPVDPAPRPAVLVLGGSEGGLSPYVERTAALLASHGFSALALAYFGVTGSGLPAVLARIPLEYFGTALGWLRSQPTVQPDTLGVVGTSRGGELALLLGATYPDIKAVVSYVGSGYVFPSPTYPSEPAWTWKGEPVAPLPAGMQTAEQLRQFEIPVERTNGPVLLISGDADLLWPTPLSRVALDRLERMNHPYADQLLSYPGAGHLITPPYVPTTVWLEMYGGTAHGLAIANANSWPAVLHMLQSRLMY